MIRINDCQNFGEVYVGGGKGGMNLVMDRVREVRETMVRSGISRGSYSLESVEEPCPGSEARYPSRIDFVFHPMSIDEPLDRKSMTAKDIGIDIYVNGLEYYREGMARLPNWPDARCFTMSRDDESITWADALGSMPVEDPERADSHELYEGLYRVSNDPMVLEDDTDFQRTRWVGNGPVDDIEFYCRKDRSDGENDRWIVNYAVRCGDGDLRDVNESGLDISMSQQMAMELMRCSAVQIEHDDNGVFHGMVRGSWNVNWLDRGDAEGRYYFTPDMGSVARIHDKECHPCRNKSRSGDVGHTRGDRSGVRAFESEGDAREDPRNISGPAF